jgi:hypothetical protein
MPLLRCRNHLDAGQNAAAGGADTFIMALTARIRTRCVGWMNLTIQKLRGSFMVLPSRW